MTDQTSPPTEPTTPPADGVAPGAGEGVNPPPPAPAKKSRTGLIVGIIAALVVLALVAVLLIVFVFAKGDEKHSITIPATAGGMKHDKDKEAELQQQLDAAEGQFKTQAKNVSYVKSGVYDQDDADRGPEGPLVFLGAKLTTKQSPNAFVKSFGEQAGANGFKVTKVPAGDGGGKAVCASQEEGDEKVAICAWATADSMGELVPTVPGYDAETLGKIMVDLRPDVEKSE